MFRRFLIISNFVKKKFQRELVRCNWRGNGHYVYHYYLSICIYLLSFPFGFLNLKKRAQRITLKYFDSVYKAD